MRKGVGKLHGDGSFHRFDQDCVRAQNREKYPLTFGVPYNTVRKVGVILGMMATVSLPGESRDRIKNQGPVVTETQERVREGMDILLMVTPLQTSEE